MRITKYNKQSIIQKILKHNFDENGDLEVVKFKSHRTTDQNDRLWKLYSSIGQHTGIDKDQIHELLGYKFLREQKLIAGMPVEVIKSTTKLTTAEMSEYQNSVEIWAVSNLGWGWDL